MRKLLLGLMAFLLLSGQILAQKTLTGRVTDEKGDPIPNASVVVKGASTVGTTTRSDGTYTLTVPATATILLVSSIGSEDRELTIGTGSVLDFTLIPTSRDLSEVVVTVPYGSIKKTAFTGSESTISAVQIQRQQVTSITKAFEGLAAGVVTSTGTGAPGTGAAVTIRGIGSFAANSGPLYVLDGAPYFGPITAISTDDIESVTFLKDAAASALYGSRAANGVIMINTKRGKRGRSSVTATVRQGYMDRAVPEYDRVGQAQYYELSWEAIRNKYVAAGESATAAGIRATNELTDDNNLVYNAYNVPGNQLINPATGKINPSAQLKWNDNWEDELFRTAPRTNATINISGGSDKSDYSLSFGYLDEDGTVKNSNYTRYNVRLNVNAAPISWLNAGTSVDAAYAKRNNLTGESGGSAGSSPFFFSRSIGPIYPVYEYDPVTGVPVLDPITGEQKFDWGGSILNQNQQQVGSNMGTRPYLSIVNPLGQLILDEQSTQSLIANANTYLEIKFLKNLSLRTTLAVNFWDDRFTDYQNNQYGDAASNGGRSTKSSDRQFTLTMNEVLSWNKSFGLHNVRALIGHENYRYQYSVVSANKTGFIINGVTELTNGTEIFGPPTSRDDNHRLESYFGGVNYDYNQKYLLSGSFRRDGSSRFTPEQRWGNFYAAGIGWRLTEESFLQNVGWLNELKFKASYGEMGNEDLGDESRYYISRTYYPADGQGGYSPPNTVGNPNMKWEGNKTTNIGFDFAMFNNRFSGTIEWYNRISSDLLFFLPLPISTGNIETPVNIGTFQNRGIDLQLGYNAVRTRDFDWRVDVNLTHYKNKVNKLPAIQVRNSEGVVDGSFKLKEGQDRYRFWLREFAGVDPATGEAMYYRDVLGTDGKPNGERTLTNNIANASYKYFGTSIPDLLGGVTNSFRYKNFDLSILLSFSVGGLFLDGNYATLMHSGEFGRAWSTDILDRWQNPGDMTNVPKLQNGTQATQDGLSNRFLVDRSYLNIKNITLSYSFDRSLSNRLGIANLQAFVNVDNAAVYSAKKGLNPSSNIAGTSIQGYPIFRTMTAGITVGL
ncbi:MAG: SusC/RagA family TonB-linked outer membrane protein [Chitinophagaceae bacterium]